MSTPKIKLTDVHKGFGGKVVLGAPNVTRGGSHKHGGLAARDVVEARTCFEPWPDPRP